jgi:hypothetical protein
MKGMRFTVPLCRFVIPLDSLQPAKVDVKRRGQTAPIQKSPSIRPKMLLRIIRIETKLETLLPKNPKASLDASPLPSDQTPPVPAPKKKASPTPKASRARARSPSSRRKKK